MTACGAHDRAERTMRCQPVPRTERHSVIDGRGTGYAPCGLGAGRDASNRLIRALALRPKNRSVFDWHLLDVGAELRLHVPDAALTAKERHDRIPKTVRHAI